MILFYPSMESCEFFHQVASKFITADNDDQLHTVLDYCLIWSSMCVWIIWMG